MLQLWSSVWGRARRGDYATSWPLKFYPGESHILAVTLMPATSVSACMPLVPFHLLPLAESHRQCVCITPKSIVGPLRGVSWEPPSFFLSPNSYCFLQPEVMGTYVIGAGTLHCGVPLSQGIPHDFLCNVNLIHHTGCGTTHSASPCLSTPLPHASLHLLPSYLSGWMWL